MQCSVFVAVVGLVWFLGNSNVLLLLFLGMTDYGSRVRNMRVLQSRIDRAMRKSGKPRSKIEIDNKSLALICAKLRTAFPVTVPGIDVF